MTHNYLLSPIYKYNDELLVITDKLINNNS